MQGFPALLDSNRLQAQKTALQPLLTLLENEEVTNVVWDGRCDYAALKKSLGCTLKKILNFQVIELTSRWQVRKEGKREQLEKLHVLDYKLQGVEWRIG